MTDVIRRDIDKGNTKLFAAFLKEWEEQQINVGYRKYRPDEQLLS